MGRKLGQHFLKNNFKIRKIISSLSLKNGDFLIEIGPGHGEITKELLKNEGISVCAIEKDERLARFLKKKFNEEKNLEIKEGDVRTILPQLLKETNGAYKVFGNIPYYITGKILRILGESENRPLLTILTIQKEVAERICSKAPSMNLLAASVQLWAKPTIVASISKRDFSPPPKVDSAILKLERNNEDVSQKYYKVLKSLFHQPRKLVINNLSSSGIEKEKVLEIFNSLGLQKNLRPQNLSTETVKKIADILYN